MTLLLRKAGSWGTWHVVHSGERPLPICGVTSRLDNDVVSPPESVERRIRNGDLVICGNCSRRMPKDGTP